MKPNITNIYILVIASFLIYFSGIVRGDVNEEEYLMLAKQKQFECVGQIMIDSASGGSCVLINENYVISAAHVFMESDTHADTMDFNGQEVIVYNHSNERVINPNKLSVLINGHKRMVTKIIIHPYYLDSLTKGSCDLAVLELSQPLTEVLPAKINTKHDELNAFVVGVGFGASGPADKPELVGLFNKKIAGENTIDSIGGQEYNGFLTLLMCDFDHPTKGNCNKMGSNVPRPFEYICSGGDSGGGLFRLKNKAWELIGITSGSGIELEQFLQTGYYGQTMEWTRASVFNDWIVEEIK